MADMDGTYKIGPTKMPKTISEEMSILVQVNAPNMVVSNFLSKLNYLSF